MKRTIILTGLWCISCFLLSAQTSPIELWRTGEYAESVQIKGPTILLDKGQNVYMLTNQTVTAFGGFSLVKYDSLGQTLWNRSYPPLFAGYFYGGFTVDSLGYAYVSPNFDGGLPGYDADAVLIKYSPTGNQLWVANYSMNQTGDEYIQYISLDPYGRLIALGRNSGSDTSHVNDFLFVSAIDTATGEEIWRTKVPGLIRLKSLRVHSDRIEVLAVKYALELDNVEYIIMQLDFNGSIIEEHTNPYSLFGNVQSSHIAKNGDVLFGNSYFGYQMVRVSAIGDTIWNYHYPDNNNLGTNWVRYVTEDDSSYVYTTGLIRLPGLSAEILTTKISPLGEVVWQKTYHSANDSLGDEGDYLVLNDSIVVVSGATQLANKDVVGLINVYKNSDGEELYNIKLGYDNIFVIDQVQLVGNKIYYVGEGFNASIAEMKVVTGCIKLPVFTSAVHVVSDSNIKIFPNPTTDSISITDLDQSVFNYLEVSSMSGQVMMQHTIKENTIHVDMSAYPAGIYIVSMQGKGVVINKKIIKAE